MRLETYIKDLLYRYDCVIIPNFGAFLSQRSSAKIHQTTHTFYPPKKSLAFNEQVKSNDGLLANYIVASEGITYNDALTQIENFISDIFETLETGNKVTLKDIGDLSFNTEKHLVFNPSANINYLTDAFGLSHLSSSKVDRAVYLNEVETIEENTPIVISASKRKNIKWLRYAAAAVFFGIGGFIVLNQHNKRIEESNKIAQEKANQQIEAKIQEASFVISNPLPTATLTLKKEVYNYHIVAGAFRFEENAKEKVSNLRKLGFDAKVIGKNKYGLHQVIYGSFSTREEATTELDFIRKNHEKTSWLLVKELN